MNVKHKNKIIIICTLIIILILAVITFTNTTSLVKANKKRSGFDSILQGKDICALAIDGERLWAGGTNGLFSVDMKSLAVSKTGDYKFIRALVMDNNGLWIGHDKGLTYLGDENKSYTIENGLPDNRVNTIMLDDDNSLWVGTWGGAVHINGDSMSTYTVKNGLLDNMVNVIKQDSFGCIWFGSYVAPRGGISVFNNKSWQYFTTKDALLHSNINAIIETHDKSVITGGGLYTKGGGTNFIYTAGKWVMNSTLTKKNGLAGEKIRSLFEDSRNRLWVGSEYDGLVAISNGKTTKLNKNNGLVNNEVKIIIEDENNNIWIGTRSGLTRISKGGITDGL